MSRFVGLVLTEAGAVAVCHRLGDVAWLRIGWRAPAAWLAVTPPVDAVAAVARAVATALAWWMLITTLLHLAAHLSGAPAAVRATGRLLLPAVRRTLAGTLAGVTLTGPAYALVEPPVPPHVTDQVPRSRQDTDDTAHTVRPGDSLWSIAVERGGDDVAGYWVRLVDVNRTRLRSGDPDLILPGERLVLPEPRRH